MNDDKLRCVKTFFSTKITEKQKQSAKKIVKFMLTKTPVICFDSGMCIAFGRYTKMIDLYFEGFKKTVTISQYRTVCN